MFLLLIIRRIAAHVSNAAPNQEEGVGGRSFQQDLAQIDEEELHTSSKRPVKRRVSGLEMHNGPR